MFAEQFGLPESRPVQMDKLLLDGALELLTESRSRHWRTVHPLVAEECMRQLFTLGHGDPETWHQQLSSWSKRFIEFCRGETPIAGEEGLDIARRVFVFRDNSEILGSERAGSAYFSEALEQIPSPEGRLEVLRHLTEWFPDEAHFWAHLGRFLSTAMKEHKQACDAIEHAIGLQPRDHVLHHMKGMVQRERAYELMSEKAAIDDVIAQAESAADAFSRARELDPDDEHGYISDAQMCLRVLDYCGAVQRTDAIRAASNPASPKWVRESLQGVEDLLAQVRQNREGERASRFEEACRADLDVMYGDYRTALQRWDSMLSRGDVYRPPIRRQIVWAYLSRNERQWNEMKPDEVTRSVQLLAENLDEEPNNERNLRLWLQAVRVAQATPNLDTIIEKLGYWRANSDSLEPAYYLFIMYCLKAFEGSSLARDKAMRTLEECRVKARYRRNRSKSFEWLGDGEGLRRLIHQDALGEWDRDVQFWRDPKILSRVHGVVRRIQGPEAGEIETEAGLSAFYVPARAEHYKGEAENRRVTCYIGFSYDGLRAWSVQNSE
jgi:tetratricopeptide (TPR) repeat protein